MRERADAFEHTPAVEPRHPHRHCRTHHAHHAHPRRLITYRDWYACLRAAGKPVPAIVDAVAADLDHATARQVTCAASSDCTAANALARGSNSRSPESELTRHPLTVCVAPRNEQMHAIFEGGAEFTDCPEETRVASIRLSIGREHPGCSDPHRDTNSMPAAHYLRRQPHALPRTPTRFHTPPCTPTRPPARLTSPVRCALAARRDDAPHR